jgi:hypothetical protein
VLGGSTGGSWNVRYGSGACLEFRSWVVKWERRGDAVQSLRLPEALYRNLYPQYRTAIGSYREWILLSKQVLLSK